MASGRSAARLATAPSTNATSTPFNFLDYPTDVVLLVVFWRLRYTLSLRDLAEMFWQRGIECTQETVREWEARLAPWLANQV